MKFKRHNIISLLLSVMLLIMNMSIMSYAQEEDETQEFENRTKLLFSLGIIDNTNISPSGITSSDKILKGALVLGGRAKDSQSVADPVLLGNSFGLFENGVPDEIKTENDLIAVVLNALGYKAMAQYNGGYPGGYDAIAPSTLTRGLNYNNIITNDEFISVLSKALDVEVQGIVGGNAIAGLGKTALEKNFKAYKEKGLVTGVYLQAIAGDSAKSLNHIVIDGAEYGCSVVDSREYLGKKVEFVYTVNDDDDRVIVHISPDASSYTQIEKNNISEFEYKNGVFSIKCENMRGDSFKIKSEAKYVSINGELFDFTNGNIEDIFDFEAGTITFSDLDGDGVYDAILIWKYVNYFIAYCTDNAIYDKNGLEDIILDIDDEDAYYEIIHNGAAAKLSDYRENDVVSVYKNKEGNVIKFVGYTYSLDGVVDKAIEKDGTRKIAISGIPYYIISNAKTPAAGTEATFYTDINGNIAGYTVLKTVEQYGYIVKVYEEDSEAKLKICVAGGGVEIFDVKDSIRVDTGEDESTLEKKSELELVDMIRANTDIYLNTLVQYKEGKDGITILKYAKDYTKKPLDDTESDVFRHVATISKTKYSSGKFGRFSVNTSDAIIFSVPEDNNSDTELYSGLGVMANNGVYTADIYNSDYYMGAKIVVLKEAKAKTEGLIKPEKTIDPGTDMSQIMSMDLVYDASSASGARIEFGIMTKNGPITAYAPYAEQGLVCVDHLKRTLKPTGEVASMGGTAWEYNPVVIDTRKLIDDANQEILNVGDIVQIQTDDENNLVAVRRLWSVKKDMILCDPDRDKTGYYPGYKISSMGGDADTGHMLYGKVVRIGPSIMIMDATNKNHDNLDPATKENQESVGTITTMPTVKDTNKIFIYNKKKGKITMGEKSDIEVGDEMFMYYYYLSNVYRGLVIIR